MNKLTPIQMAESYVRLASEQLANLIAQKIQLEAQINELEAHIADCRSELNVEHK